ncbi:hypothetical protein HA49_12870 [Tatumella morbirosei]|uniref:Uncharacterized protein n=1 Tax=Tatumella morbirosei TaxID=642227 RepID=A0A095T893_9GAMM|nr:hypothetical protein [Tatumella morbirosei]KGD73081.1 hypothetical protein HA49_12870 [Tatumella morbirosei]
MADSLNDATSIELKISAASGSLMPSIYANGRNQLAIEVSANAYKTVNGEDITMEISEREWQNALSLCYAESDKKLKVNGTSDWCYTLYENEFSREIVNNSANRTSSNNKPDISSDTDKLQSVTLLMFYLYTTDVNVKRIAVRCDTDNGQHYTTADNALGVEKSSVRVNAVSGLNYNSSQYLKVYPEAWVTNGIDYHFYNQIWGQSSYSHYTCTVQHKRIKIILSNGYEIKYKKIVSSGIPSSYPVKKWYVNNEAPYALVLAHSSPIDSQGNGCYLNSWYIEPEDGHRIGHPPELNPNFTGMAMYQAGWPSLYFSGSESGRYDAATWAYWPNFTKNNTSDKTPNHAASAYENEVTVYAYQLHIPNSSSIYWGLYCKPSGSQLKNTATVSITDNYGNSGQFIVSFNSDVDASITLS